MENVRFPREGRLATSLLTNQLSTMEVQDVICEDIVNGRNVNDKGERWMAGRVKFLKDGITAMIPVDHLKAQGATREVEGEDGKKYDEFFVTRMGWDAKTQKPIIATGAKVTVEEPAKVTVEEPALT